MIKVLKGLCGCEALIDELISDDCFSAPMCPIERVRRTAADDSCILLSHEERKKTDGVFSFLVLEEELYMESMFLFSKSTEAYRDLLSFLKRNYKGFEAWFVMNPGNAPLRRVLEENGAEVFTEQRYMVFTGEAGTDTDGVLPLSEEYADGYVSLHSKDVYWTGEKILNANDRFRVFLYVEDGRVAGYVDISSGEGPREIFDILVAPSFRGRGIGRKLLNEAVRFCSPDPLTLTVDIDNRPALHLYSSFGFAEDNSNSSVTARCIL